MTSPFQQQLPHEIFHGTGVLHCPAAALSGAGGRPWGRNRRGGSQTRPKADLAAEPSSREFIRQAV